MELTKEHIGKKVRRRRDNGWILVEWVRDGACAGVAETGEVYFATVVFDDWEIVEEPKKPSERIGELLGTSLSRDASTWAHQRISAVISYLDEQAEKNK